MPVFPTKIFSAAQMREADLATLLGEPVTSIGLMERAAAGCAAWLQARYGKKKKFHIFCGEGNNGGDGLAIARLLTAQGCEVKTCLAVFTGRRSEDNRENGSRLPSLVTIRSVADMMEIPPEDIIIDALFGTGLSKPLQGLAAEMVAVLNASGATIVAVDMPSGLFADRHTDKETAVIKASHTLSFQLPRLAFLFPENAAYTGKWHLLDIGLDKRFISETVVTKYLLTETYIHSFVKGRPKFSHKGNFGHALLVAGSYGKTGAAVLAVHACLRSGVGLVTAHIPACGYQIMQVSNPEAMVRVDRNEKMITDTINNSNFTATGIGPGMGMDEQTGEALKYLLLHTPQPLVLDADALNLLSADKTLFAKIPEGSVLTPHPKEFERLAGTTANDFERHERQLSFSKQYKIYIILKGAHTCITTPGGEAYFNNTGNPGMAKAGSGDLLTGILTGLLAQGYTSFEASLVGVWVHGLAGDLAAAATGETGMTAKDIAANLPAAFEQLIRNK